jgi:hypothetical protein
MTSDKWICYGMWSVMRVGLGSYAAASECIDASVISALTGDQATQESEDCTGSGVMSVVIYTTQPVMSNDHHVVD